MYQLYTFLLKITTLQPKKGTIPSYGILLSQCVAIVAPHPFEKQKLFRLKRLELGTFIFALESINISG